MHSNIIDTCHDLDESFSQKIFKTYLINYTLAPLSSRSNKFENKVLSSQEMRLTLQSNYFYYHENLENTAIPTRNNDIFQDEIAPISKLGLKIMLIALS